MNETITVECLFECGASHEATFSHFSAWDKNLRIYALTCDKTGFTEYVTSEIAVRA